MASGSVRVNPLLPQYFIISMVTGFVRARQRPEEYFILLMEDGSVRVKQEQEGYSTTLTIAAITSLFVKAQPGLVEYFTTLTKSRGGLAF